MAQASNEVVAWANQFINMFVKSWVTVDGYTKDTDSRWYTDSGVGEFNSGAVQPSNLLSGTSHQGL